MDKQVIIVPDGIRYISEWKDYCLPLGHCIINKVACGCGFTQNVLVSPRNSILCSPRVALLENKAEQNSQCYYFKPVKLDSSVRRAIIKDAIDSGIDPEKAIKAYIYKVQRGRVSEYINQRNQDPLKFLVTYDSIGFLTRILRDITKDPGLRSFDVVVDEFQLIFTDAAFKSPVEMDLLYNLQGCSNVTYVSATPMLDRYLEKLDEFKDLPYYELDWGNRVYKPFVDRVSSPNLEQTALELIKSYLQGKTESATNILGQTVKSRELVLYLNSVSEIIKLIKAAKLTPDQVNIIVSRVPENQDKISALNTSLGYSKKKGIAFEIGRVPLRGEQHKMFTFCTSTAYCGVDFYSDNARTVVFSNCNIDTLMVDIALDLPQILGRQRLSENPWKNRATFFTSVEDSSRPTWEEFKKKQSDKIKLTLDDIAHYFNSDQEQRALQRERKKYTLGTKNPFKCDYVALSPEGDFIYNKLVEISELRAWEINDLNYKNMISMIDSAKNAGLFMQTSTGDYYQDLANHLYGLTYFDNRMEAICNEYNKNPETQIFRYIPEEYKYYIDTIGTEGIKKCKYKRNAIEMEISKNKALYTGTFEDNLKKTFIPGERYTFRSIKSILQEISEQLGMNMSFKATDLGDYFNIKPIKMTIDGRREHGYEILGIR
jgi:hypothetical protein